MSYLSLITMYLLTDFHIVLFILLAIFSLVSILIFIIEMDSYDSIKEKLITTFFCSLVPILFMVLILNCINGKQNTEYYFQKILENKNIDNQKENLEIIKQAVDKNFSIQDNSIKILENNKEITDFNNDDTIVKIINIKQNKNMVLAHIYFIDTEYNLYEKDAVLQPDIFNKIERNFYVTDHDNPNKIYNNIKISSEHDLVEKNIFENKDILLNNIKKLIEE